MKILLVCFLCGMWNDLTNGANILGVFPVPAYSHHIIGLNLLKALAEKGHNVTMLSPFRLEESVPNYTDVPIAGVRKFVIDANLPFFGTYENNQWKLLLYFHAFTNALTETAIRTQGMQRLLKSDSKFDLILMDPFDNQALFGLSHRFNAPVILICTGSNQWINHLMGNVAPYSFVPNMFTPYSDHMTFTERCFNTFIGFLWSVHIYVHIFPFQRQLYNEIFPDAPDFEDSIKNASLAMINSHPIFESSRPYTPNMIHIGGLHIAEGKRLPQDLQKYLDEAKDGAIFFSIGSNLHGNLLPVEKREVILKTFAKLPQRVLWKFEDESLPGLPENVRIGKWFPQNEILAHPNLKLLITHGGQFSSIEALYWAVPIVGIPLYADQYSNVEYFVKSGCGTRIYFEDITEDSFTKTIREVLGNPRFYENIKHASEILKDQPIKPLDNAIFWVEYVIKYRGANHLRSKSVDLNLIQYLLLDVVLFTVVALGIFIYGILLVVRVLCCQSKIKNRKKKIT